MEKRKILIDTDPGIDDGCALFSALAYDEFDILGIMCVAGNKSLDVVVPNALRIVDFYNKNIPVLKGAHNCLSKLDCVVEKDEVGIDFHGKDGMGESGLEYSERCLKDTYAIDFMLDQIQKYPNEIELITLGPLTNIALACQKDLETMKKLKSITVMGGSLYLEGNTTKYAEYNIWFDAPAADIVFNALADDVKITMVGQDCNCPVILTHHLFDLLSYEGGKRGQVLERMTRTLQKSCFYGDGVLGLIIHDLSAMLSLMNPSIITKQEEVKIQIQLDEEHFGQTKPCEEGKNIHVILEFDRTKLIKTFLELMLPDKQEIIDKYLPVL